MGMETPQKLNPPSRVEKLDSKKEVEAEEDLLDSIELKTGAVPAVHLMALSDAQQEALKKLLELEEQYTELEKGYDKEYIELQVKYDAKYAPLLAKRTEHIAGGKLPNFWRTALQRSEEFGNLIEEHDVDPLDALQTITFEYFSDRNAGWKLQFHFAENAFFTNKVLTKTYHTQRASEWEQDLEYTKVEAEAVQWKPGKDVTVEKIVKKGKKGKAKAKEEVVSRPSFFRAFFRNLGEGCDLPSDVEEEDPEEKDSDEESLDDGEKMEQCIEEDSDLAELLRDTLVPHAVRFYTHEAGEDDADEEDEEEEGEEEEEDDDDLSDTPPEGTAQ